MGDDIGNRSHFKSREMVPGFEYYVELFRRSWALARGSVFREYGLEFSTELALGMSVHKVYLLFDSLILRTSLHEFASLPFRVCGPIFLASNSQVPTLRRYIYANSDAAV